MVSPCVLLIHILSHKLSKRKLIDQIRPRAWYLRDLLMHIGCNIKHLSIKAPDKVLLIILEPSNRYENIDHLIYKPAVINSIKAWWFLLQRLLDKLDPIHSAFKYLLNLILINLAPINDPKQLNNAYFSVISVIGDHFLVQNDLKMLINLLTVSKLL